MGENLPPPERLIGDYGATDTLGERQTIFNQPVNAANFQLHPSTINQLEREPFTGKAQVFIFTTGRMSRQPILIKDLVKGNQVWKMCIRVVDLWVVIEKNGQQHLEAVIQDGQGDKIHVITRSRDFPDWVEAVKEHETYNLYNGEPVENDVPLKVCCNPLKLIFNGGTTMTKVAIPEIPAHKYSFFPIEKFLKGDFKHDMLYDVIGVLQDVLKTQMGGGGRKSCVNVNIRDVMGNVIELVLWDDYAKQFVNYTTPNNFSGPTLIVLTHAWCKPNTDALHITFQFPVYRVFPMHGAALGYTLTWIIHKLISTKQGKKFLGISFGDNMPAPSQSMTCDSSIQSSNNFWTKLSEVKSVRAISDLGKDCYATTIGTTIGFNASRFGWYFESTGNTEPEPVTKFKLEVEVEYENHKGIFVFWDKDCIPFTKLTAKELREVMKAAGEDNPKIWPTHLDVLLNMKLVFRIKYQAQYQRFSIVKILNEDGLYNKFHNYLTPDENTTNDEVVEMDTTSPNLTPNQVTKISEPSTGAQPPYANHSGSPTASSSSTPAKRIATSSSVNDAIQSEELTPKQSATKPKTGKKTKHIKKE
ncbi:uncharacterized protein LOC131657905 [Vicia villosa]|uniref:uncharacterized protein LOC131657905 n=1 Tax=Vicia villosa TaxID=3911 RepID=UPI00273AAC02|nr:uncharacterized protein LOC131657905 [Vicia villosa]